MKTPKVGETIYAFQWECNRVGKTEFLTTTQAHAFNNLATLQKQQQNIMDGAKEMYDPPQTEAEILEERGELIVYEMKRIK